MAVASRYLAGGAGVEVGGDWYDLIELPGGRRMAVLGDVAGRGVNAAVVMGQLRNAMRAYALDGRSPSATLERLNRYIVEGGLNVMATVLCAEIDRGSHEVRFSSAGHPPPLLLPAEGEGRYLWEARSLPIGVVPFPTYAESVASLPLGSTLVLYSDGLVERRGVRISEGLGHLLDTASAAPREPEALCDVLLEWLATTAPAEDDTTLLAVHVRELGDVLRLTLPSEADVVARQREALSRWLEGTGASPREAFAVTVASGEAMANAITHGSTSENDVVEFEASLVDEEVSITVRDHGRWKAEADGGVGGQGIPLMRKLMDDVTFSYGDDGTTVRLFRRLGEPTRAGSAVTTPESRDDADGLASSR